MRILFIVPLHENQSPGQRFRFEQCYHFFRENGIECIHSEIITKPYSQFFYSTGHAFFKAKVLFLGIIRRIYDVIRSGRFDLIFIYRECFFIGGAFFEKLFSQGGKIVFDFDDSIWLPNTSAGNQAFSFLKKSAKTRNIISLANAVTVGNRYLADYASRFNKNIHVVPTSIDVRKYQRENPITHRKSQICIGWSGSLTTIQHFEFIIPVLSEIKNKYRSLVSFKVIGDGNYQNRELNIQGIPWTPDKEVEELCSIDIGIMPLQDDPWTKGKCGLKALQYMSLEIPVVTSPVGVNSEIVQDGVNGFLAKDTGEWLEKLSLLMENLELRERMGKAGRKTVEEKYSSDITCRLYLDIFNQLISSANA